mgnify:CR=1 FL=1
MGHLLALILLFAPSGEAYSPVQNTFVACGAQVPLPPGISLPGPGITSNSLISLGCFGTGAGPYCSGRRANALSGYQVPSGKTFKMFHTCVEPGSTSTATTYSINWSTADAGADSGSPPAGIFWYYGYNTADRFTSLIYGSNNQGSFIDFDVYTGKYPGGHVSGGVILRIYGYEY